MKELDRSNGWGISNTVDTINESDNLKRWVILDGVARLNRWHKLDWWKRFWRNDGSTRLNRLHSSHGIHRPDALDGFNGLAVWEGCRDWMNWID